MDLVSVEDHFGNGESLKQASCFEHLKLGHLPVMFFLEPRSDCIVLLQSLVAYHKPASITYRSDACVYV